MSHCGTVPHEHNIIYKGGKDKMKITNDDIVMCSYHDIVYMHQQNGVRSVILCWT